MYCANAVTALNDERSNINLGSCLGTYGGPIFPNVVLGGYDCETDSTGDQTCNYMNASALIITLPIDNHVDESLNGKAEAWESVFLEFMANLNSPTFDIAYSAERSISVCLTPFRFQPTAHIGL
jgi:Niemann-Pick C1 protein